MKGTEFYYSEISNLLLEFAPELRQEFLQIVEISTGREVYFWLTEKKKLKKLPKEVDAMMSDFYWELF